MNKLQSMEVISHSNKITVVDRLNQMEIQEFEKSKLIQREEK